MLHKKYVRISLVTMSILVLLIVLGGLLIPLLFEKQVKQVFINELNKNLATEVVVQQEDITLETLRYFPYASITFRNVAIRESLPESKGYFLEADNIRLLFNIFDLLKKNYTVTRIILSDAQLLLTNSKEGVINYHFWESATDTGNSDNFSVSLKDIQLRNVAIVYDDRAADFRIDAAVSKGNMTGNLTATITDIDAHVSFLNNTLQIGDDRFLSNAEVALDLNLTANTLKDIYTINSSRLQSKGNTFLTTGSVELSRGVLYDLAIEGEKLNLQSTLQLLPDRYASIFSSWISKGNFEMQASVLGQYNERSFPAIRASFAMENGELYHQASREKLEDVELKGTYTNGDLHRSESSKIDISGLNARFKGEPLTGKCMWSNFTDPTVAIELNGRIPASLVLPLLHPAIDNVTGTLLADHLSINGRLKDIREDRNLRQPPSGSITGEKLALDWNKEMINLPSITLKADGNNLHLQQITMKGMGSDLEANLVLRRWTALLSNAGSSIQIDGNIKARQLDLARMVETFNTPSTPNPAEDRTSAVTSITTAPWERLSGTVQLNIDNLSYEEIQLSNLSTQLYFSRTLVAARSLEANTQQGHIRFNSTLRRLSNGNFLLENVGTASDIDIAVLFRNFNNFGQSELTAENIKGKASLLIENLSFQLTPDYAVLLPSLYTLAQVSITDGALINYKPLEELSGFVSVDELKNVSFSRLDNQIEIRDQVIYIPVMEVRSSALNLSLSGTHTFDNRIDYQFRVGLGELLGKKFLRKQRSESDYDKNADGGINIYVSMQGTVNNPVISFNKKDARDVFRNTEEDDGSNGFLEIFKSDHSWQKEREDRERRIETAPADTLEFIEWDDE